MCDRDRVNFNRGAEEGHVYVRACTCEYVTGSPTATAKGTSQPAFQNAVYPTDP